MQKGKIIQIIGPVVDVLFSDNEPLPEIYTALIVNKDNEKIFLEVLKHLEPGRVRAIAMQSTDGLRRGTEVINTGKMIQVPVGEEVLGNIFNITGQSLNNKNLNFKKFWEIHRQAPNLVSQSVKTEIFETGIKVIDL
ncbi:MAG: F0F1 ATP synthase subunit beta, partial [Minisyncoccia bacterium]